MGRARCVRWLGCSAARVQVSAWRSKTSASGTAALMRLAVWRASIARCGYKRLTRPGCASLVNGVLTIVALGEVPQAMQCSTLPRREASCRANSLPSGGVVRQLCSASGGLRLGSTRGRICVASYDYGSGSAISICRLWVAGYNPMLGAAAGSTV